MAPRKDIRTVRKTHAASAALALGLACLVIACATQRPRGVPRHGWWGGRGAVVPHDTFPADCGLCHEGGKWNSLKAGFHFDHEKETGFELVGAHEQAECLRCHNDRGPVATFQAQGCAGCHEDIHQGQLGAGCEDCHRQVTWQPYGQLERHNRTRFPLTGAHAATSCRRCHPGSEVGRFVPTDVECLTCHRDDLANANNPNHVALGWIDRCDRCHLPTTWNQAQLNPR